MTAIHYKKIYISIMALTAASILLVLFIVYPAFKGIKESSQQLLSAKNQLASLTSEEGLSKESRELYEKYRYELEQTEDIFIDSDVPLELIDFLEDTATSSQIQLKILSVSKNVAQKESWPSLTLQISATGNFSNFLKFLEKAESGPYLIDVSDLTIRRSTERDVGLGEILFGDTVSTMSIKVYTR